ncbi:phasin family protein [Roseovarius sp. Pro17]|uniref:phasin family protein n=1 Tax=Roseovarius sp. Pro17 TaxID=3108175 RepID=UPI002D77D27C|nr:phasin family protein [Roseovarius sp. Pro17]
MTESAKNPTKSENEATTAATDTMNALGPMGETAQKIWTDMGNETLRFVASRVEQDLETQKALLACTNLAEVQKIQAEFFTQALEQYRVQATRMMEMMSEAAPKGLPSLPIITSRGYDDVPL